MTGLFIIARLGSTRLPNKHLIQVNGKSFIQHLIGRIGIEMNNELTNGGCKIVIVTSDEEMNREFEGISFDFPVSIFYGNVHNIPRRQIECATNMRFDNIVSIDGDDILVSPKAVRSIFKVLNHGCELAKTAGLPLGMNVMGYSLNYLKNLVDNIDENLVLETGWGRIFEKDRMNIINFNQPDDDRLRFTLDYPEDETFFKAIFENLGSEVKTASDSEVISFVTKTQIFEFNAFLNEAYWSNFENQINKENRRS